MLAFCFRKPRIHSPDSETEKFKATDLLHGPTLQTNRGFQNPKFVDEINEVGCYVHVVSGTDNKITGNLEKLESGLAPTPATYIGIAPVRVYNVSQWQNRSGLIISPDASSLVSYKHDFYSNRIRHKSPKTLSDFNGNKNEYARHLASTFDSLRATTKSHFYPEQTAKELTLTSDIEFARAKYNEMQARSNLRSGNHINIKDESSKFVIADILALSGKSISTESKTSILKILNKTMRDNPLQKTVLEHAVKKIGNFSRVQLAQYAQKATDVSRRIKRRDYYSKLIREHKTIAPNEHLLLPRLDQILGVYVNASHVSGIDHAFQIKESIDKLQSKNPSAVKYQYALLYQPGLRQGSRIAQVGWAQALLPWTSKALIEFAKTGLVTSSDGKRFPPNHSALFSTYHREHSEADATFLKDLSTVKDRRGNNLLHLALLGNRGVNVAKFFHLWGVNPLEKNLAGVVAMDLAPSSISYTFLSGLLPCRDLLDAEKVRFMREHPTGVR